MKLSNEEIRKLMPHRPPMLLVDEAPEVVELEKVHATFYADPDWVIFDGHFPGDPIVPGVLCVECMAQALNLTFLISGKYKGKTPLFAGIRDVRFKEKFLPGMTADIYVDITEVDEERDLVTGEGELYVGDTLCCTGTLVVAPR